MADDRPEFDLYAQDFYAWTQAQALRLRGAGGDALDYDGWPRRWGDSRMFRVQVERRLTRSIRNGMEADLDAILKCGARLAQEDMDGYADGVTVDPDRRCTLGQLLGEADDPLEGGGSR